MWLVLGLEVTIRLVLTLPVRPRVTAKVLVPLGPGEIIAGKPLLPTTRLGMAHMPLNFYTPSVCGTSTTFALRTGAHITPTLPRWVTVLGLTEIAPITLRHTPLILLLTTRTRLGPFRNPTLVVEVTPPILLTTFPLRGVSIRVLLL